MDIFSEVFEFKLKKTFISETKIIICENIIKLRIIIKK